MLREPRRKLIGGMFGLEPVSANEEGRNSPFTGGCVAYFLNGRCALYAICQLLKPKMAWLPSYLCRAVLDPFRRLGVKIQYYDARPNYENRNNDWITEVHSGDLVVTIHYFGFANATFPAKAVKERGAVIIEDASQGLFVKQQYSESFCIFYSARKFLGVPDGGPARTPSPGLVEWQSLDVPPIEWWRGALRASQLRREFDLIGGENLWFPLFQLTEEHFPVGVYRASDVSRTVIDSADYDFIRSARRSNYSGLLERLGQFALFPELDAETVPLGFPVCVDATQRDAVLEFLYGRKIYPPVHWRIEGTVPKEYRGSHALSQRILTLICDQRYTNSDMARQATAFLSALSKARKSAQTAL